MFELKVANAELTGPSCQVSWCVDAETLKYLSDNKITNPQVVIVVAPEGRTYRASREYRKVVDMKDLMTYVDLRCAGANKIWGFISSLGRETKGTYLCKKNGEYTSSILESDGAEYCYLFKEQYYPESKWTVSQPQPVVVPTGVFAPEPAEWEKAWVNHFFRNKPEDQCEFRRRRLFAYTLQLFPLMFLNMLLRLAATTVALVTGARDFSLDLLLHPLDVDLTDFVDMWDNGSVFVRKVPEDSIVEWEPNPVQFFSYVIRKFCFLIPFLVALVWALLHCHAMVPFLVITIIFGVFVFAATIVTFFVSGTHKTFWNWLDNFVHGESDELWYLNQDEMDLLTCGADKKPLDFKSLPKRKKTLYLRFQDLKSKVCKPFSG